MAKMTGVPKVVWVFVIGGALLVVLNIWLMKQVGVTAGDPVETKVVQPRVQVERSSARIPKIDPANDLLAPVGPVEPSPQDFLKARPQKTSDEKDYEMPQPGTILLQ
jgi:hypothetical protein